MSRKKKNRNQEITTSKILLATVTLDLIRAAFDLIKKLFE